jgi:hypothetical protein
VTATSARNVVAGGSGILFAGTFIPGFSSQTVAGVPFTSNRYESGMLLNAWFVPSGRVSTTLLAAACQTVPVRVVTLAPTGGVDV